MHNTTRQPLPSHSKVIFRMRRSGAAAWILGLLLVFPLFTALAQEPQTRQVQSDSRSQATNVQPDSSSVSGANVTETLIDESIPDDPAVLKMLEPYSARVRELDTVIGRLQGELRRAQVGAGSLGNFVSDGMRAEAGRKLGKPLAITVTNGGGMRKSSIAEGELRVRDIFELLPFENRLIRVDLTGDQLLRLLVVVLKHGDAQSGARITYRLTPDNRPEFVSANLIDAKGKEQPINPKAIYRIVTIDYLYNLKSGNYSILGEGKDVAPLDLTLRDALLNYVKTETAQGRSIRSTLDNRFTQTAPNPKEGAP